MEFRKKRKAWQSDHEQSDTTTELQTSSLPSSRLKEKNRRLRRSLAQQIEEQLILSRRKLAESFTIEVLGIQSTDYLDRTLSYRDY